MNPVEFLDVAKQFSASIYERETRTSVGRSYYAVFNHLRLRIELLKPLPSSADAHNFVVRYLSDAPNKDLKSVAQTLRDLRTTRNTADYDMQAIVDEKQSQLACQRADKAIQKSRAISEAAFKAAIDALPTYR